MHTPKNILLPALLLLSLAHSALAGEHNKLTDDELEDGWILLFDGETTFGWHAEKKADWNVTDGAIRVSSGEPGLLATTSEFGDFALKVDFLAPATTNSGIFLRTPTVPTDPQKDCYELNIAERDVSPYSTGSLVGRQKADRLDPHDGWRTFEVTAIGGRFQVWLDGKQVLDYIDKTPLARGRIGLQFNQGQVTFRNIKLKPLSLKPIFNGKNLDGWKVFDGKPSVFSVTKEGAINVKNGPGQLETDGQWADFVLQLDVYTNGKGLNSGIFFRSIPGEFWQGYESQIHNGYKEDRSQPVDCGTGGFYRRQNARRVVADDFTWFHKTLVVSGDHMATWVNGYQVTDFTDSRPTHENPRKGLHTERGTLSIQGHDPTTDLSLRKIRIVELPAR